MSLFRARRFVHLFVIIGVSILIYSFVFGSRISEGDPVPDFQLIAIDGKSLTSSDLLGRAYLLHFWAYWCDLCVREMDELRQFQKDFANEVYVVTIHEGNEGKDIRGVKNFIEKTGLVFDVYMDEGNVGGLFGVRSVPVSILVDKEGKIAKKIYGPQEWTDKSLRDIIQRSIGGGK